MYYALFLLIALVVGFGVGIGVYFYNRKGFEEDIEKWRGAYNKAKDELEKKKQ